MKYKLSVSGHLADFIVDTVHDEYKADVPGITKLEALQNIVDELNPLLSSIGSLKLEVHEVEEG